MPDASSPAAFIDSLGEAIEVSGLAIPRAQHLAGFLQTRDDIAAHLVEARQRAGEEWLILNVDVDVGQLPAADIRREERIAVGFSPADSDWPRTLALRDDFPDDVSHQFLRIEGEPVALCLSEEAWQEARLRWSPGAFIRLLRAWLIGTASNTLHRADQAVEPFIAASTTRVILPADLFDPARQGAVLYGVGLQPGGIGAPVYIFDFEPRDSNAIASVAAGLIAAPKVHGVVQRPPRTLAELLERFGQDDPSFGEALDAVVSGWVKEKRLREAWPLLLVQVSMLRQEGEEAERQDLLPFMLDATVAEVAEALDLWSSKGGEGAGEVYAFSRRPGPYGESIRVGPASLLLELNAAQAADFNGLEKPSGQSILAVGAGALGSQIIANLTRMGESVSTIIDQDRLFPHNLARHAVWDRELLGWPKAQIMGAMLARLHCGAPNPTALVMDVADSASDNSAEFIEAAQSADVALDMAASIAVSRRLTFDVEGGGRRVSAFLSPNGRDLVILAEDRERTSRLDHLEMALYAGVLGNPDLAGHFDLPPERRYARGCRDVSARLPQTAVALHAAVAAEQVRHIVDSDEASAGVWRLDRETMTVRHVALDTRPMRAYQLGDWTVLLSEDLRDAMDAQREARLPAETGGVLLGTFDADRRIIHVVAHVPAPSDSVETPDAFIRGAYGMEEAVKAAEEATLSVLRYVGEWHSHPDGVAVLPSGDDLALFVYLAEGMETEGHPPVMVIVGRDQVGVITQSALGV